MSILICKQCKESYDTSWGYHNDDYCTSSCHIDSLEAENAELKAGNERLVEALEQIVNCEEGARDMWETAKEALEDTK